jgi:hypothetical protein
MTKILEPDDTTCKVKQLLGLLLILIALAVPSLAQQRRSQPPKTPQKTPAVQPAPTFDTLLASDSYKIYGEVRGVGQLVRSGSVNDLLEPVIKLAAPPREFKTAIKWLTNHADALSTSRLMFATWPISKNVPDLLLAVEFASPEEATEFEQQLNQFLPKVSPAPEPSPKEPPSKERKESKETQANQEAKPNYYLKRAGALVFLTNAPLTLKNLRPANSKPLAEDPNFRTVHDRFTSESVLVYVDLKSLEKEEQEQRPKVMEGLNQGEAAVVEDKKEIKNERQPQDEPYPEQADPAVSSSPDPNAQADGPQSAKLRAVQAPDPMSLAMTQLAGAFFSDPKWPDAIGIALSFDADSYNLRALLVNAPGEKSVAIPFFPQLHSGPSITPESPSILPADTELLASLSLDLPQIYAAMNKPPVRETNEQVTAIQTIKEEEFVSPFAVFEQKLGIKVKDDLLPLLGNEVAFSMPIKSFGFGAPGPAAAPETTPGKEAETKVDQPAEPTPIIAISLRDKEGMRRLLPRIIEAFGFKGASSVAQTEKREDTELVSYVNAFAYAFVGNFLILSTDANTTRHVVDSYLKHETLGSESRFRNYTRWQPKQLQGQVYVSPVLMENYSSWAAEPSALLSEQTREFLVRLGSIAEPITYSLSNEGMGPLHELHVPKNLALMAIAGMSGETDQPPTVGNERATIGALYWIANAETQFKSEKGGGANYATLEQLIKEGRISKDIVEDHGYKFELLITGDNFEVTAVPVEYGKTGKTSYYIDQKNVLRGGDHAGGPATIADKPIR